MRIGGLDWLLWDSDCCWLLGDVVNALVGWWGCSWF